LSSDSHPLWGWDLASNALAKLNVPGVSVYQLLAAGPDAPPGSFLVDVGGDKLCLLRHAFDPVKKTHCCVRVHSYDLTKEAKAAAAAHTKEEKNAAAAAAAALTTRYVALSDNRVLVVAGAASQRAYIATLLTDDDDAKTNKKKQEEKETKEQDKVVAVQLVPGRCVQAVRAGNGLVLVWTQCTTKRNGGGGYDQTPRYSTTLNAIDEVTGALRFTLVCGAATQLRAIDGGKTLVGLYSAPRGNGDGASKPTAAAKCVDYIVTINVAKLLLAATTAASAPVALHIVSPPLATPAKTMSSAITWSALPSGPASVQRSLIGAGGGGNHSYITLEVCNDDEGVVSYESYTRPQQ
jgi:hypothetical protein